MEPLQYLPARLSTLADKLRGAGARKLDLSQVRPFFEAAAALHTPDARTARSVKLLERGLQLPKELCRMVASRLLPEAAASVELAFFAAFSPELQQTVLRELHAVVMQQQKPTGLSWPRYLDELSRLRLPRTDAECIYRMFAGTYPPALASVWPWQIPTLGVLASTQLMSERDRNELDMSSFFNWADEPCSHAMLRDDRRLIFVGSSANRHRAGWADSPHATPNQVALTFAPAGDVFGIDVLQEQGIASNRLTCVNQEYASFLPPVLSDLLKAEHEVIEDHIPKFVPPRWTIGYVDPN